MSDQNSWKSLRINAPLLSYSLLFQNVQQRELLADILSLGLEFDFILAQASEPILALIRLKWWEEQINSPVKADSLPLLSQLNSHISAGYLSRSQVVGLIQRWQDYAETAPEIHQKTRQKAGQRYGQACWSELLMVCIHLCGFKKHELARQIGAALYDSRSGTPPSKLPSARQIYRIYGKGAEFLIILAYLARRGASSGISSDNLILFKIIWQIFAKPNV
jgi:hypothetical protein